jgi:hypothetical protein
MTGTFVKEDSFGKRTKIQYFPKEFEGEFHNMTFRNSDFAENQV